MATSTPRDYKEYGNIAIASTLDASRGGIHFILVGAGGNGARVVPPLMQILYPGDHLSVIDHDVVEERNLGRQHFAPGDVGRYKALVLSERYRRRTAGTDLRISSHTAQLTEANARDMIAGIGTPERTQATILIGCVDNAIARKAMLTAMGTGLPMAWVDVGNAFKDGQVVLTLQNWPAQVKLDGVPVGPMNVNLRGMELAMPQLLVTQPGDAEEASCRDRVDLQSVMINVQAASMALNVVSWLKLKSQILSAGSFFSSMCSAQPIRFKGFSPGRCEVYPETTYAAE